MCVEPPSPSADGGGDEHSFILPGGKVDPDAVRAAIGSPDGSGEEGLTRVTFRLSRDLNKRLDKYLTDRITFMSRTQLQKLIDVGGVSVNERVPKASTRLRVGDVVEVVVPLPPSTEIQGEDIPIEVLFEDDDLLVLNKAPGIVVHPARSHNRGTLLNALVYHFRHRSPSGGSLSSVGNENARPGVIHRLDRDTTGVMAIAKSEDAHWKLGRQFELRQVDKRYLAIVRGAFDTDADVIDLPIGPHPSRVKGMREKMVVRHDSLGKAAVTICRVRQRFRGFTLVELELKTGRTHQIRVHLSYRGFPLVGDDMYGGPILKACHIDAGLGDGVVMSRQALHAAVLGFRHPIDEREVRFTAPVWADMGEVIRMLREHAEPSEIMLVPGSTVDLDAAIPSR